MRAYLRDLRGRFPIPQARDEKTGRALQGPAFAYDRWAFSESAETLEQEGLAMVDFPQNATTMGPASTQAFELVTTGRLAHDGDPVLAEHVANTTAILTERGMKVTKPRKVTPRKNDAGGSPCRSRSHEGRAPGHIDPGRESRSSPSSASRCSTTDDEPWDILGDRPPYHFIPDDVVAVRQDVPEPDDRRDVRDPVSEYRVRAGQSTERLPDDLQLPLGPGAHERIGAIPLQVETGDEVRDQPARIADIREVCP